ncbi:hypothetical protein IJH66_03380 [Candidatus Saccharibacteria bacterium]|nr:hypothetical protein [Candidatus Saccharibacteria bacterium]
MKRSDIITVVLIAVIGTIAAYFAVDSIMGNPEDKVVSFKYVANEIGELVEPDDEVFNGSAINPTVEVYVGSCVDANQDATLSLAEKVACGLYTPDDIDEIQTDENEDEENRTDLDEDE